MIRTEGLEQGYGGRTVFSGLNIRFQEGVCGLLGPNGAGKTTLLKTVATIIPPRRGSLEICGRTIDSDRAARRARRDIGYLPQDFGFTPGFSVFEFVRYCAWLREVPRAQAKDAALRIIDQVGLADRAKSPMKSLSGGMLRRAGIASAMVAEPRVLLLDEPTVGLDPEQRYEFRDLIRRLEGVTVVLSTHLVEDVSVLCGDVVVLDDGAVRYQGSTARLTSLGDAGLIGDSPLERGYLAALRDGRVGSVR